MGDLYAVLGQVGTMPACLWGKDLAPHITFSRQRVPMIDASTLEGRTRPALDGSIASRVRYFSWPSWTALTDQPASTQPRPIQARLGRRRVRRPGREGRRAPTI